MKCFAVVFDFAPGTFGAEQCEDGGDGGGVTEFLENAFDARKSDGGEEVFEIEVNHGGATDVRSCVGHCPATGNETVGSIVGWNLFEDMHQDPLLRGREIVMRSR